jgi:hypothetical protein
LLDCNNQNKAIMKNLHFTQEQITTNLAEVAIGKEGMHEILSMALEAMMLAERKPQTPLTFFGCW